MDLEPTQVSRDFVPGETVGKYVVIRRLATGGMAEIYLAYATGIEDFKRVVVLKRILPQFAHNNRFREMFLDEARLAAKLHHHNIGQVFDIGHAHGGYFFTMEYVHGLDARRLFHAARVSRPEKPAVDLDPAITIVLNAAAGLHYAHEKRDEDGRPLSIVHRDVSPSNIIVTYDGAVKVVDFGIAKAMDRHSESVSGSLKGKLSYMSPEQVQGQELDRRSDVFSLGVVLYELTTGDQLFSGNTEFVIINRIAEGDIIPPSKRLAKYPRELERIVMRCLQAKPEKRYQSMSELQQDLEQFAVDNKLSISAIALARYMRTLFGDKVDAWRAAADSHGALTQHLTEMMARNDEDSSFAQGTETKPPRQDAATADTRDIGSYDPQRLKSSGSRTVIAAVISALVVAAAFTIVLVMMKDPEPSPGQGAQPREPAAQPPETEPEQPPETEPEQPPETESEQPPETEPEQPPETEELASEPEPASEPDEKPEQKTRRKTRKKTHRRNKRRQSDASSPAKPTKKKWNPDSLELPK